MTPPFWKRAAGVAGGFLLAGVFIFAAVSKIAAPNEFARAVYQYHLLPDAWINPAAVFLPWLELLAGGALLLAPRLRDAAAAVIAALLLAFAVSIALNLYRGIEAPCGCFAVLGKTPAGWGHLVVDLTLAAIAGWVWFQARRGLRPAEALVP